MKTTVTPVSYLDDPVAFASELDARLGNGHLPTMTAFDAAFATYEQMIDFLRQRLAEEPEAVAQLGQMSNMCLDLAMSQYRAGLAVGAASELLRQTLLAARDEPPVTSRTTTGQEPPR